MLRVKKGCANKARGYIKIKVRPIDIGTLPEIFTYEKGTYLGYEDVAEGNDIVRTYRYSPETTILSLNLPNKTGIHNIEIYRLGIYLINLSGCTNLKTLRFDRILDGVLTVMTSFLYNCTSLEYIYGLENLDVSRVSNCSQGFKNLDSLKHELDISGWNTSKMVYPPTFGHYPFDNIDFIKNWDLSKSKSAFTDFIAKSGIKSVDLSNCNLSLPSNANNMFNLATELESVNLTNVNFDATTSIINMFYGCNKLVTLDLSGLKTILNGKYAFRGCTNLILLDLSNIDLPDNADITGIFDYTPNLKMPKMDYCTMETKLKIKEAYDNRLL